MAAWRRKGGLEKFESRLIDGMLARGYERDFAEAIFRQIQGFGEYGFPESHAASFALLVYVSCWLKRHEPAAFLAALLNSQPMGFYAPAQLVRDAREHGVEVRGVDVLESHWESTLAQDETADPRAQPAVRLGLNRVRGFPEAAARRLVAARATREAQQPRCARLACDVGGVDNTRGARDADAHRVCDRRKRRWRHDSLSTASRISPAPRVWNATTSNCSRAPARWRNSPGIAPPRIGRPPRSRRCRRCSPKPCSTKPRS